MRFRVPIAIGCATALCLAGAGAVLAGSRSRSGPDTVRLALRRSVLRAGQTVLVPVVNGERSMILRSLCLTLARREGSRWVPITHTHGVAVPCPPDTGIPQHAGTRQPVSLPLYDDLVPGRYRITLRYKSVSEAHPGKLSGPAVRSLTATLTVLAFKPGPEPRLSEHRLLALAEHAAAESGDRSPWLIQHVETTRFEAVRIGSGDLVFAWNWSYLIAERGHFTAFDASVPPGAKAPTGSVMTLVVDAKTGRGTDGGLGNRYPPLAEGGPVTTDRRRARHPGAQ